MPSSYSNLSELTVTCNRCGGASMERIGNREYRCTHCGAITVVSQEQAERADAVSVPPLPVSGTKASFTSSITYTSTATSSTQTKSGHPVRALLIVLGVAAVSLGVHECNNASSTAPSSAVNATVPAKLLNIGDSVWTGSGNPEVNDGHYTALIANHSNVAVDVPRYTMTLYENGVKGQSANSEIPVPRLLPGEYEPISWAFYSQNGNPRLDVTGPDDVMRDNDTVAKLVVSRQQLVREEGKTGYRFVAAVENPNPKAVASSEVLVMLFTADHDLIAFGKGYITSLRAGEKSTVNVDIPTTRTNAVASYEYLVDGSFEVQP